MAQLTAYDLEKGDFSTIASIQQGDYYAKLLEMGCVPGETVQLLAVALGGDPVMLKVGEYALSLRKQEAKAILIS